MFPSYFFFLLSAFFCLSFSSLPLLFDILKPKKVPTRWGLLYYYVYPIIRGFKWRMGWVVVGRLFLRRPDFAYHHPSHPPFVVPDTLQKCVGDFCCVNFGGFCRGFSWRIFLGTLSHKIEKKIRRQNPRKIRRPKNQYPRKSVLPRTGPNIWHPLKLNQKKRFGGAILKLPRWKLIPMRFSGVILPTKPSSLCVSTYDMMQKCSASFHKDVHPLCSCSKPSGSET